VSSRLTPAVRAAEAAGLTYRLLELDEDPDAEPARLATPETVGVPSAALFQTLVAVLDTGELVCAVIPAHARLGLKALATEAGAKRAELAEEAKAERSTGYVTGAISPLGQKRRLRCFMDASAESFPEILVNGGRRGLQIATEPMALARALDAALCPLAIA
jgi:Cys-tRNA(Pro)/Cys-tRNA(Cys) deacylase